MLSQQISMTNFWSINRESTISKVSLFLARLIDTCFRTQKHRNEPNCGFPLRNLNAKTFPVIPNSLWTRAWYYPTSTSIRSQLHYLLIHCIRNYTGNNLENIARLYTMLPSFSLGTIYILCNDIIKNVSMMDTTQKEK